MERHTDDERPAARRRPPPDRGRGSTRALSERAARFASRVAATDRRERFHRRRQEIEEIRRSRRRRTLWTFALSGASTVVAVVVGALLGGSTGVAVGLGAVALTAVGLVSARWLAARRGATAWDWQLQRHRLIANPSERVRDLDEQRDGGSDHERLWGG